MESQDIAITKFLNPNCFFYYNVKDVEKLDELIENEVKIEEYLKHDKKVVEKPIAGHKTIYVIYHETLKKWIRVEVINVLSWDERVILVLWCIDYGITVRATNKQLIEIPNELQHNYHFIKLGSLDVQPASYKFSVAKKKLEPEIITNWSAAAVEICSDFIKSSPTMKFHPTWMSDDHEFGDINAEDELSLTKILLEAKMAVQSDKRNTLFTGKYTSGQIDFEDTTELSFLVEKMKIERKIKKVTETMSKAVGSSHLPLKNVQNVQNCNSKVTEKPKNLASDDYTTVSNPPKNIHDFTKVFIHGENVSAPINSLAEAEISSTILSNMRKKSFHSIYRLQSYSWGNIHEGSSTFIINGKNTGKTFCYLPIILSSIHSIKLDGIGPIAIIIVTSSEQADTLLRLCYELTLGLKDFKIIKATGNMKIREKIEELLGGCHLLITTPPCFKRLSESNVFNPFDKKVIRHLIFDDLDMMTEKFLREIKVIIGKCTFGSENVESNPQIIVTTKEWNVTAKTISEFANQPIMLFGNFAEASLFAKCRYLLSYQETLKKKIAYLLNILTQNSIERYMTLVIVNNEDELSILTKILKMPKADTIDFKIITVNDSHNKEKKNVVYLITDEVLSLLNHKVIYNKFEHLIHFSMPEKWSHFTKRFITMFESFRSTLKGETVGLKVLILLDNENTSELPRIYKFLKRHGVLDNDPQGITHRIGEIVDKIEEAREQQKIDKDSGTLVKICPRVLSFGSCNKQNCPYRHALTESDAATGDIPSEGYIKFEIIQTVNPTNFIIKVLEHYSVTEKKWISHVSKINETEEMLTKMQKIEKISKAVINIYDLCVVENNGGILYRCKISKIAEKKNGLQRVEVLLIDEGKKLIVQSSDILVLPDEFQAVDPLAISLQIVNFVPYDYDDFWNIDSIKTIQSELNKYKEKLEFSICGVKFSLKSTIFTDSFHMRKTNDCVNAEQTIFSLKKYLMNSDLCVHNENVEKELKKLFKNSEIYFNNEYPLKFEQNVAKKEVPVVKSCLVKKVLSVKDYEVYFRHFEHPESFFVVVDRSNNTILKSMIEKVENYERKIPMKEIEIGNICLWLNKNGKCQRGRIDGIDDETVQVFLIDEGLFVEVEKNEIFECPNELIDIFPMQAVECSLAGIKCKFGNSWTQSASQAIGKFLSSSCGNDSIKMRVVNNDENVYKVLLFDPKSNQRLDQLAIQQKLAAQEDVPKQIDFCLEHVMQNSDPYGFLSTETFTQVCEASKIREDEFLLLNHIAKHPKISWRDSSYVAYLEIEARDAIEYDVGIDNSSMEIFIKYQDRQNEVESIKFYDFIQSNIASWEKSGEKIIVRLPKQSDGDWPRLTLDDEPNKFITRSHEDLEFMKKDIEESSKSSTGKASHSTHIYDVDSDDDEQFEFSGIVDDNANIEDIANNINEMEI